VIKLVPVLLLLAVGASSPDCPGGKGGGGNAQFDPKIKPGNPLDLPFGIYQIVGVQGYAFFQDQATGSEREVYAVELQQRIDTGEPVVLVDVRPADQFDEAHIPTSVNVPLDVLFTPEALVGLPSDGTPLVLVSANGHAASLGAGVLGAMGYNVYVLRFGLIGWATSTDVAVPRPDRTQTIRGLGGPLER